MISVLILSAIGLAPSRHVEESAQVVQTGQQHMSADCKVLQHLIYRPCKHEIVRGVPLPSDLVGKDLSSLEASFPDWQIVSFSPAEVEMEQQLELFCPEHVVLQTNESGILCIWQNTYGDAMSLVRELSASVNDFPDDIQEQLRFGVGFDTMDDLSR